jgi:hypothetical protein
MENGETIADLRDAIQLACQPQNAWRIEAGRKKILAMPRLWVIEHIEQVANDAIDLSDYWEYRRLLEVAAMLDRELLQRLVAIGSRSHDPDVSEAAADFAQPPIAP